MIERLEIINLGPAERLVFEFGPRLNLITGDNGLGKTFALDLAWYALTQTWADGRKILPNPVQRWGVPLLRYRIHGKDSPDQELEQVFKAKDQEWTQPPQSPTVPGLIVYARLDGGFCVWDPARNIFRKGEGRVFTVRPGAYDFKKQDVWEGLTCWGPTVCNGLIHDLEYWRLKGNGAFRRLQATLAALSPSDTNSFTIAEAVRVSLDDAREIPVLDLGYGRVPITQISAGMRRVLSLAYLLVWSWTEHLLAADLRKEKPTNQIILLFDEVEAHLHPQWQRLFLPALKALLETNLAERPMRLQVIATTHAPLVLASVEPFFDPTQDRVFTFELQNQQPVLRPMEWSMRGDASAWLRSPFFGLDQARSKEAEVAIEAAEKWMRGEHESLPQDLQSQEAIHARLQKVLPEFDRFWPRWIVKREKAG